MSTSLLQLVVRRAKAARPRLGIVGYDESFATNCYVDEFAAACAVEMML